MDGIHEIQVDIELANLYAECKYTPQRAVITLADEYVQKRQLWGDFSMC